MSEEGKITMKLLVDTNKRRVLFAEAEKECVDFLFHILSLPLGKIVEYISKESMTGSIGNLYGSLESLSANYVQEGVNKDCLLKPKPASGSASNVPLLTVNPAHVVNPVEPTFFTCSQISAPKYHYCDSDTAASCHMFVSNVWGVPCPKCQSRMVRALSYVKSPAAVAAATKAQSIVGYVKGVVTYMIMDDLSVQPMSMVSGIALLNKFNVRDVGGLEEREVTLDINLGLAMLKASLMSKTVLTDVFMAKKEADMK